MVLWMVFCQVLPLLQVPVHNASLHFTSLHDTSGVGNLQIRGNEKMVLMVQGQSLG